MSIRVRSLNYHYRARTQKALDDVSAEFKPGQVTLIAGPSGCGKTTLARCINGLIPRSYPNGTLSGNINLFGHDSTTLSLAQISQVVGTVLQDPEQQIIASSVMSEIAFGLENLGLPRQEIVERVEQTASLLHITHLLPRETFTLSGGEKQKVALAGVLAMRPRALLLDEPLALLDPAAGHQALQLLRELADRGIAVIIIEHRIEDVLSIHPEQCLYMTLGKIRYSGDAQGLVEAADWREMKLPAPVIIQRLNTERHTVAASFTTAPTSTPSPTAPSQALADPPIVEFSHVNFQYGDGPEVLHDITFAIRAGDRIALLGPNGAGKTTLVKHAIGLHKPTYGQVRVMGRDSRDMSVAQIARTVGYVFQSPSHMLFARTVREEVSFGPRNLGFDESAIADSVTRALATVNLSGSEDDAPLAMSFGQQKRISIASILSMNPRLLVMDEPSAGQDYASYTHFMNDIVIHNSAAGDRAAGKNVMDATIVDHSVGAKASHSFDAVLFITHDLDLAITYANRILLVADGSLAADGPPHVVLLDQKLLERCHIAGTSLLVENIRALPKTGHFLPAPALAAYLNEPVC
jgi:energy-coupling factor transport system ATP-binding protein